MGINPKTPVVGLLLLVENLITLTEVGLMRIRAPARMATNAASAESPFIPIPDLLRSPLQPTNGDMPCIFE